MKKIDSQLSTAFHLGLAKKLGNTATDGNAVTVFGNMILRRVPIGGVEFNMCGWGSDLTRRRVNTISRAYGWKIRQIKGRQCLYFHHTKKMHVIPTNIWVNPENFRGVDVP